MKTFVFSGMVFQKQIHKTRTYQQDHQNIKANTKQKCYG